MPSAQDAMIGICLGNLEIVKMLGKGAMGTVFLARHMVLGTPYAIKILAPEFYNDRIAAERFRQEAMVGSSLRHPNIAFVTDFGYNDDVGLYIVMEYLPGKPLAELIDENGRLTLWQTIQLSKQLCDALEAAHALGTIHRDLKPDNVFVMKQTGDRELVKVLDWGLARLIYDRNSSLVQEGMAIGTPIYMSPEQIDCEEEDIGPRADIYALGLLIYEMLLGVPPFQSDDSQKVMLMHLDDEPDRLSEHRPELSETILDELIARMLEKDPDDRPQSMMDVKELLAMAFQELQEKSLHDMVPPTFHSTITDATRSAQLRAVPHPDPVDDLQEHTRTTLLERLFHKQPTLSELPPTLFFITGWGALSYDLLHSQIDSPTFRRASIQLTSLIDTYLQSSISNESRTEMRQVLSHVLEDLFKLTDQRRQLRIIEALKEVIALPLFPHRALPGWARPQVGDTWRTLRQTLNTDLRDLFQSKRPSPASKTREILFKGSGSSGSVVAKPSKELASSNDEGLVDKLSKEITIENIRDILDHEIHIFPKASDYDNSDDDETKQSLGEKLSNDMSIDTIRDVLGHEIRIFPKAKARGVPSDDDFEE